MICLSFFLFFFFFNDTATTEIYTLSLHDALPIYPGRSYRRPRGVDRGTCGEQRGDVRLRGHDRQRGREPWCEGCAVGIDRKSTRLNSSHQIISYAVFCLKKKKKESKSTQEEIRT